MPNDYYDFNPSATTWVLMLSCMVLFVVVLSLLLIYLVHRSGQTTAPAKGTAATPQPGAVGTTPREALAETSRPDREVTRAGHAPAARAS